MIRVRVNPGEAPVKNFVFGLRANGGGMIYHTITPAAITANKEMVIDLPTADWCAATDMANYPISLISIQLNMNASKAGQVYNMHFNGFETVYLDAPEAPSKKGDINGDGEINANDVTALINKILSLADYADAMCDLNGDGEVNIGDVTALINLILK